MAHFRVTWEIDIEAGTPVQAARQAFAIQRDSESTATCFDVQLEGACPSCKQHVVHTKKCRVYRDTGSNRVGHIHKIDLSEVAAKRA
jgi:hypothetical protein